MVFLKAKERKLEHSLPTGNDFSMTKNGLAYLRHISGTERLSWHSLILPKTQINGESVLEEQETFGSAS